MIKFLYSVYDKATCLYSNPYTALRDAEAVRAFRALLDDPQSLHSRYPEDFALYRMGNFDDNDGNINTTTRELIAQGTDLQVPVEA